MTSVPFPVREVRKFGQVMIVPPLPRTSWGLSEDELATGYARCGSGCSAPVVLQVTPGEWLCEA